MTGATPADRPGRWVALVNPAAGHGRAAELWGRLRAAEPRLAGVERIVAGSVAETAATLAELLAAGADRILVLGGDGSVQLAGDTVLSAGAGGRAALGLVPAGTGSDLARNLGVPRDPLAAARRALDGRPRAIDALLLTADDGRRRHLVNAFSAGISGPVDVAVNAMKVKGRTGYLRATLAAIARYRPVAARLVADGEEVHSGPLYLAALANSTSFGNGMKVAPPAVLDDGFADLVWVGDIPMWQVPFYLPRIYLGTHLSSPRVHHRRVRRLRIEPLEELPPYDLDGEVFEPAVAAEVEVLPGALRVLV